MVMRFGRAWACAGLLLLGCGDSGEQPARSRGGEAPAGVATYQAKTDIPECNLQRRSSVYYVSSEEQFYFCDGTGLVAIDLPAGSAGSLVVVVDASVAQCAAGGFVLHVGADDDGDGVLETGEVDSSKTICNGADGADGAPGADGADGAPGMDGADGADGSAAGPALVEITEVPPGDDCPAGGHLVDVGNDGDGDGELDAGEVTDSDYACSPLRVLEGSFEIDTAEELELLRGVYWIAAGVTIRGDLDLSPLEHVSKISSALLIADNHSVTDLSVLSNLTEAWGLMFDNCSALASFDGLENLAELDYLSIHNLPNLTSIEALGGVTSATAQYSFTRTGLTSLAGLDGLTSFESSVTIDDNDALVSLNGLGNLTYVNSLNITGNASLPDLSGLGSLTTVASLQITDNDAMTSLAGLNSLTAVDQLIVHKNDAMTSLTGVDNLTSAGHLDIQDNDALANLVGLGSLTGVGNYLTIASNDALTDLTGLGSLESASEIQLIANGLTSVDGLHSLTTVSGLRIQSHPSLVDLRGLEPLETVTYLVVHSNASLPACEVDWLVSSVDVLSWASISDNNDAGTCPP